MTKRTLRAALFLALPLIAACKTGTPAREGEHWVVDSVPERMVRHLTGYRADLDGSFVDFQYRKKKHIDNTLRRHFANNSSDSPFEGFDDSQTKRRGAHSIAPDPLYYMHAESLFIGFTTLGIWGTFVPIPIDSLTATIVSPDGWEEFWDGFTAGGSAKSPPPVSQFRVRNR